MAEGEEIVSREIYFTNYFHHLSTFSWEKAKEFAEKKQKIIPIALQVSLSNLAQNEKTYFSMEFLEQRSWFGRKDPLKNAYSNLQTNLLSVEKHEHASHSPGDKDGLSSVCLQLADFCAARLECINLYMQIPKSSMLDTLGPLAEEFKILHDAYSAKFSSPMLRSVQDVFNDETTALLSLFQSSQNISEWNFVDSVHNLQEVYIVLEKWKPILGKQQSGSFRSGFFGFVDRSSTPTSALYSWMEKFFRALVSKFTFYFYENMLQSAGSSEELKSELKTSLTKLSYDFVSKSLYFARKQDVQNISLILDVRNYSSPPQHGYQFPKSRTSPLAAEENLNENFMVILSLPESSFVDLQPIASLICDKPDEFQQERLVPCLSSEKKGICFCSKVDSMIYLAVTFNQLKSEKDAHLTNFFNDCIQNLKLKKVALLSKPSSK